MPAVSFPHPILGNGEAADADITVGQFEPLVELGATPEHVQLTMSSLHTGNPTIDSLVNEGRAAVVVRLSCSATLFRVVRQTIKPKDIFTFRSGDLRGSVELEVAICALQPLPGYNPAGKNSAYGSSVFDVQAGQLLTAPVEFSEELRDKAFDPLKQGVGSLFKVRESEELDGPFRVIFDEEMLVVELSKRDHLRYRELSGRVPGIFHGALVLPVLTAALPVAHDPEHQDLRWAVRLRTLLQHRGIDCEHPLEAAQELLASPLDRGLSDLQTALEEQI